MGYTVERFWPWFFSLRWGKPFPSPPLSFVDSGQSKLCVFLFFSLPLCLNQHLARLQRHGVGPATVKRNHTNPTSFSSIKPTRLGLRPWFVPSNVKKYTISSTATTAASVFSPFLLF